MHHPFKAFDSDTQTTTTPRLSWLPLTQSIAVSCSLVAKSLRTLNPLVQSYYYYSPRSVLLTIEGNIPLSENVDNVEREAPLFTKPNRLYEGP